MNGVYLVTGGNMGDREALLAHCLKEIEQRIGRVADRSSLYETASWGLEEQSPFLNQVLKVETPLDASEVLKQCLEIEKSMGRVRDSKWASRLIDIDILFFNEVQLDLPSLKIPHPHLAERKFVLVPLCEIAAEMLHPLNGKTMQQLLYECRDKLKVELYQAAD